MTWKEILAPIKNSEYSRNICFPPKKQIFRALELTPFDEVKVVILGQDPYHNDFQANGLCFSVSDMVPAPPSLKNIYKELESDLNIKKNTNDLASWALQGVLLLNTTLTVKAHEANSHKDLGWEQFTDFIIKEISTHKENIVFVLWGAYAQKKSQLIDSQKHLIIKTAHPSPLSAHRGFLGSKPFSKINNYLSKHQKAIINW